LLFFVPVFTRRVAPGADMAMHAGLARALVHGTNVLSPAWGNVRAAAYPRGFSAWIALASQLIDIGRASLLISAIAFVLFYFGLRSFFRDALRLPNPNLLAAFLLLASWTPQAFFRWGGGPSVLAMGFGLLAAGELANAVREHRARGGLLAALWLVAAMWTHPIGACIGAALSCMALALVARRSPGYACAIGALALLPLIPTMFWLSRHGPVLSNHELDWIRNFQDVNENVLGSWPRWLFPITVWRAIAVRVGPVVSVVYVASCIAQWRAPDGRRGVLYSIVALEWLGLLLAFGPRLPALGFLIYPSRLMPLALPALAIPIASALAAACEHSWTKRTQIFAGCAACGALAVHIGVFQAGQPIATDNDLKVAACFDRSAPADAVVDGAYGDATQWLPALTGRLITHPHIHCSLFDEVERELSKHSATHRFVGERLRYGDPLTTPLPTGRPLCQAGGAALYRLDPVSQAKR
jgi:hypothetical protein